MSEETNTNQEKIQENNQEPEVKTFLEQNGMKIIGILLVIVIVALALVPQQGVDANVTIKDSNTSIEIKDTVDQNTVEDQNIVDNKVVDNNKTNGAENMTNVVEQGDKIKVDYVGKLEDGTVFDTSIEQVAKDSNTYVEQRPYQPLEFTVGAGQMIQGFDKGVVGMKLDETKKLTIPPAEAYGEKRQDMIAEFTEEEIKSKGAEEVKTGMIITMQSQDGRVFMGTITKIVEGKVSIDFNHELAGKTLIFEVTVKEINKA